MNLSYCPKESLRPNEIRQVVFAKIHKAASSTVQNILVRFSLLRGLDILLPKTGNHINEFQPEIDPHALIESSNGKSFDILCNHLVFNEEEIANYIPLYAFKFGILRAPLSQALSALRYYATFYTYPGTPLDKALRKYGQDPVDGFLNHPQEFCDENFKPNICYLNNRMSMDLGLSAYGLRSFKRNHTEVQEFVAKVDRQFDLMLLFEYFDESMILLRRYLNWEMKDVIYIKVNAAPFKSKYVWNRKPVLNSAQTAKFQEWEAVDIALYDYFSAKFFRKIGEEHSFNDEVEAFKQIRSTVENFCQNEAGAKNQIKWIPSSRWTREFSVSIWDCQAMMLSEDELIKLARTAQLARLKNPGSASTLT